MAGKRPSFQFYPGDWLRDRVSYCSIAAQGLWLRMMIAMHDNTPYGYLTFGDDPMPEAAIAQACGVGVDEYRRLLQELVASGVVRKDDAGRLYCKRMVRDEEERASAAGRMRNSRRTSAQHHPNNGATSREPEEEGEEEDTYLPTSKVNTNLPVSSDLPAREILRIEAGRQVDTRTVRDWCHDNRITGKMRTMVVGTVGATVAALEAEKRLAASDKSVKNAAATAVYRVCGALGNTPPPAKAIGDSAKLDFVAAIEKIKYNRMRRVNHDGAET